MPQLLASILDQVGPATILDIGITALLIYWVFSLIRGTSAVRLVIGVTVLFAVYFAARFLGLRLLIQILETGAVVGLFALVVVFQPELRRALDRIGRVGSLGWLISTEGKVAELISTEVSRAAAAMSAEGHGALIVIEQESGLEQYAETGVMIHGDLSADLLRTIFSPKSPLHDGAVLVRGARVLAAGAVLPLSETTIQAERFGTRHRAALGITEQTDAIVVVVSEENGHVSFVQRARIVRNLNEGQLARALRGLLEPGSDRGRLRLPGTSNGSSSYRLPDLGRAVRSVRQGPAPVATPGQAAEPADGAERAEPEFAAPATGDAAADGPATAGEPPTKPAKRAGSAKDAATGPPPESTASPGTKQPRARREPAAARSRSK